MVATQNRTSELKLNELKLKLKMAFLQARSLNIPRSSRERFESSFDDLIRSLPVSFEESAEDIIQHIVENFRLNDSLSPPVSESEATKNKGFVALEYEVLSEKPPSETKKGVKKDAKKDLDGTLSKTAEKKPPLKKALHTMLLKNKKIAGGNMQDLSGYKDLSKPPVMGEEDESEFSSSSATTTVLPSPSAGFTTVPTLSPDFGDTGVELDSEFSSNVRTLIRLVNDLPEGVTKQTGAQIIRLTMEAMGISMEDVLTEAQSAQSEMLDAVRANIKKIEEYKTVIRRLESDIKFYQGKANELSEIIDLFILSNTSPQVPNVDALTHE